MFYSIPGVLKASLTLNDVDYSDVANSAEDDSSKVLRRTRVSFESHPSVVMEDMLADFDQEFGDERILDLEVEDILSMFENKSRSSGQ